MEERDRKQGGERGGGRGREWERMDKKSGKENKAGGRDRRPEEL